MTTEQSVLERTEKLERAHIRLKWIGGLLMVLLAALVIEGRMKNKDTVEAGEFLIRNSAGKIVARLGIQNSATCLQIFGNRNAAGIELCAGDEYGASLLLRNDRGRSRAFLSAGTTLVEPDGSLLPGLIITDQDGKNLVSATVGQETRFMVGHGTEENSFTVSITEAKKPMLSLFGTKRAKLWTAP